MGINISISGVLEQETKPVNDFSKRIFDILVALTVLIFLAPFTGLLRWQSNVRQTAPSFIGVRASDGKESASRS